MRESFRQSASKVAKAHKKTWPILNHLIVEKVRSRRGSNVSCGSQNSSGSSAAVIGTPNEQTSLTLPATNNLGKQRTQSFNAENAMQHAKMSEVNEASRARADSYVVENPIPEEDKI